MTSEQLLMFEPTDQEAIDRMTLDEKVARAVKLLKDNEPEDGYYLAFSGGKDSVSTKKLLDLAEVKYSANYNVTTIDPPEVIWFIKKYHPETIWHYSRFGNMMHRLIVCPHTPPTRNARWCCEEYKEGGGKNRVKVFGVRKAESRARKARWNEITLDQFGDKCICPVVLWSSDDIWEFIRYYNIPYCSLYDEGWDRVGCVGCPLVSKEIQDREFSRWPRYEQNWKRAIIKHWDMWHDRRNTRTGQFRFEHKFATGEDLWYWWRNEKMPDYIRGTCQTEQLWTNEPGMYDEEAV